MSSKNKTLSASATPTQGREAENTHSTQRRILGATGLMMAAILLSRVLGLVRDRVIAHRFGQGLETDAYNAAFTIPDLLFFLIAGGALSAAFIPVFTEYIATDRKREAWRIFSVVASVMTLVVIGFILIGEYFAYPLVVLTNPGWNEAKYQLTTSLTRILLPAQLCFFLGGLMIGTQTAQQKFQGQAFGPVIYNLGIILGGVVLTHWFGVAGLCWGAVGGAVIGNLLLQWVIVRRMGGYFVPSALRENWNHPGVRQVWKLMLPVILGLALPQVSTIIGKGFAAALGDGPTSALMNANRLMQVPLGVFAQATAIATFPTMAAQAALKDFAELRKSVSFGIRSILFLTVPSSAWMVVLALPIIQLLLQSGKFNTEDARITAQVLQFFAVGIFAWSAHAIITRGFYALQETRTPVIVGTLVTLVFIPLNWPLREWLQVSGLALAVSIAATLHMSVLLFLLRRRLEGLDGQRLLTSLSKTVLATAVSSLACLWMRNLLQTWVARPERSVTMQAAVVLGGSLAVSIVFYLGVAFLLRMEEVSVLRRVLRRRGSRGS